MKNTLFILLCLSSALVNASLGNLVSNDEIPDSVCLAEFSKGEEVYHCSGAMVDNETFKTAAHCLKDDYEIEVRCKSSQVFKAEVFSGHKSFSHKKIKRDLYARRYDHALLKLNASYKGRVQRPILNFDSIEKLLDQDRECAFFGVGLNPWYEGTGLLHGVRTTSSKISIDNGLLIVNDPHGAVTMIGDSGASFFCRNNKNAWINIGTVSAHSWENETIVAINSTIEEDNSLIISQASYVESNSIQTKQVSKIEKGKTYRVLPFSNYVFKGESFNSVDRLRARMIVKYIEGDFAYGTLEHYGPALYYLCFDGVSCDETLNQVKISISDLVESYSMPLFIDL